MFLLTKVLAFYHRQELVLFLFPAVIRSVLSAHKISSPLEHAIPDLPRVCFLPATFFFFFEWKKSFSEDFVPELPLCLQPLKPTICHSTTVCNVRSVRFLHRQQMHSIIFGHGLGERIQGKRSIDFNRKRDC